MKKKQYANFSTLLMIFLGSVFACSPCAGSTIQDNESSEKLLAAIRDADAQAARAFLSKGAEVNARDDDGLTALRRCARSQNHSGAGGIIAPGIPIPATG
jgi:ankyrin repeat protein